MKEIRTEMLLDKIQSVLGHLLNLEEQEFGDDVDPWKGFGKRDFGIAPWDWPQGVGLFGMEMLQEYYGDTRYDSFFTEWIEKNQKDGLPSANINTTAPYNMLLSLALRSGNKEYEEMCMERAKWLIKELPKTKEGGFQHVTTDLFDKTKTIQNEEQLWIDTLFMAVMFLAKAGVVYEEEQWIQEAIYQMLLHIRYLFDKQTGLFYHGFSFERMDNFGGIYWARGNSWFTYGVLQLLNILDGKMESSVRRYIISAFTAQVKALTTLQAESGLWNTILTDSETYEEVSGSALFAASIYRAVRTGILPKDYIVTAEKALWAILDNIADNGAVMNVSSGTAMGLDEKHYKDIIIAEMPYGQAMTMLALLEAVKY
ncbi:glycoside hydrolase family 88 protein, partial [Lachnospiraceae bacterium OttesenSCG-928-D06]|nr:glycoside hydrolase family 88 protein [Lachnospiraceae bacterium OttesenSCG-928-D06]